MSRLHGRIERLEANRPDENPSPRSILERYKQVLECAQAIAEGKPLLHKF
jgi:hypothetical protein